MKTFVVIATKYGSFIVHTEECPIIDRDYSTHGVVEYTVTATSRLDLMNQIHEVTGSDQRMQIFMKRFSFHSLTQFKVNVCEAEYLK
jgi:hypothetical protein